MKIIVIGGTGLIGKRVVANLNALGHQALSASPSSGVNTITGEGLAAALDGADVVVDVSNSPSWTDEAVMEFFTKSTANTLAAAPAAGVRHYVALSIVGVDLIPDSGYMRAKVAQEKLITASGIPHTILRATQFFEFIGAIGDFSTRDDAIHLPSALIQPIAAADVSAAVTDAALSPPANATIDLAGPKAFPMHELLRVYLQAKNDNRQVIADEEAGYYGAKLKHGALVPAGKATIAPTTLEEWLQRS